MRGTGIARLAGRLKSVPGNRGGEIYMVDADDPEILRALIAYLLHGWEGALHSRDSAAQAGQALPDYMERYQEAMEDPTRSEYTREKFSHVRKLLDSILEGRATRSEVEKILADVSKKPN